MKLAVLLVLPAACAAAFVATMPEGRGQWRECQAPPISDPQWASGARDSAIAAVERLFAERGEIYGFGRRAERHAQNLLFSLQNVGAAIGIGDGSWTSAPTPSYLAGTGARVEELGLVFTVRDALQIPDCLAADQVPDSNADSLAEATRKLERLRGLLAAP